MVLHVIFHLVTQHLDLSFAAEQQTKQQNSRLIQVRDEKNKARNFLFDAARNSIFKSTQMDPT
jgi:hypothetical protein